MNRFDLLYDLCLIAVGVMLGLAVPELVRQIGSLVMRGVWS